MEAEIRENSRKTEIKKKEKKEVRRPAPLPKAKEVPVKFDVQKMRSFHTMTMNKVSKNSPQIEYIDKNEILSSREALKTQFCSDRIGPKVTISGSIASKPNNCYRPVISFSKMDESMYENSYFHRGDGEPQNSSLSALSQNLINFSLTR